MGIRDGMRAAIHTLTGASGDVLTPSRSLSNSALFGPGELDPVFESPWAQPDALNSIILPELYGDGSGDYLPITRAEAISIPAIARARGVVCNTLGRLDLVATTDGQTTPQPNAVNFLAQPDPAQSRYIQLSWTYDDMIFYGVSWWIVTRYYADGSVASARRILPGGLVLEDGGKVKVYGEDTDPSLIRRIDGPHEGILTSAARTLRGAAQLERSGQRFAGNPVPAVELHQTDDFPMTPTSIQELIESWAKARQGRNGGVAYTPRNIEVNIHGEPAENLLLDGRNLSAIDGARVVGIPADSIDASPAAVSMTYANVETRSRALIDYGLAAYGYALESRLSMNDFMVRGTKAHIVYGDLTKSADADPNTDIPDAPTGAPVA